LYIFICSYFLSLFCDFYAEVLITLQNSRFRPCRGGAVQWCRDVNEDQCVTTVGDHWRYGLCTVVGANLRVRRPLEVKCKGIKGVGGVAGKEAYTVQTKTLFPSGSAL
jgi:hypothetical protein